jgi:preprotein translocase subunit SecG
MGLELVIGIILIVMSVFLIIAVLMQSGKDKKLSGAIAGGAETFFGKSKASAWDKILSKATTVVSIIFTILVIVMYIVVSK